jgi:choline monooxygenase
LQERRFKIDPDISQAKTLDTDFYTDPSVYRESKEKIFSKSWQFVGDKNLVSKPGSCYPFTMFENYLDEPLLLLKDAGGKVRCLSNVCTHRGTVLIGQPCQVTNLRCRYHGRQFRLDGSFLSMPEFKEVKSFPTKEDDLKNLPLYEWGPLLFCSLDAGADPKNTFRQCGIGSTGFLWMNLFLNRNCLRNTL